MTMLDIIELVAETAKIPMYYIVELLEEPKVQDDGRYEMNHLTHDVHYSLSADDTIQFLSDHELFGWEVQSYTINNNWDRMEELKIVLHRNER